MKDAAGRVIYVGKAKDLRNRAGSYFLKAAAEEQRTAGLVQEIRDIDFLEAESEVDALLLEARLVKDVQPKFNQRPQGRQDLSLPGNPYPGGVSPGRVHPRAERAGHEALWAVCQRQRAAGGDPGVAEDLPLPHLRPRHPRGRPAVAVVPALPAGLASTSARPPATCGSRRRSTARTSAGCSGSWKARRSRCSWRCGRRWKQAARELRFEEAARLRDEIRLWRPWTSAASWTRTCSPRSFTSIPSKGVIGLQEGAEAGPAAADHRGGRHRPSRRQRDGGQPGAVHRRHALQAGLQAVQDPGRRRGSTISPPSTRSWPGGSSGCTTRARSFPTCC